MGPQAGHPVAGPPLGAPPARDVETDYRRLLAALCWRARRLGSRDPDGAAQEALRRSLENAVSQAAVAFYFGQSPPDAGAPPEWPLDRLFAWLHGVLHYVVKEEQSRVGYRCEVPMGESGVRSDPADPAADPLEWLIREELEEIVADCFPALADEYRTVLKMRGDGLKYGEIAVRLGVNENTVATWVSRGIRELARSVRRRTGRLIRLPGGGPR